MKTTFTIIDFKGVFVQTIFVPAFVQRPTQYCHFVADCKMKQKAKRDCIPNKNNQHAQKVDNPVIFPECWKKVDLRSSK